MELESTKRKETELITQVRVMSAIQEQMEFRMRTNIKHSFIRYSIVLLVSSTQHLMLMIPGNELCKSTNGIFEWKNVFRQRVKNVQI